MSCWGDIKEGLVGALVTRFCVCGPLLLPLMCAARSQLFEDFEERAGTEQ